MCVEYTPKQLGVCIIRFLEENKNAFSTKEERALLKDAALAAGRDADDIEDPESYNILKN